MIPHDVELDGSGTSVAFDPVSVEGQRVAQLVSQRQGEAEAVLVSEAVQHVEHRAAGRLVGLQEHDVSVGLTGTQRRPLSIRGRKDGSCGWLDIAGEGERILHRGDFKLSGKNEESKTSLECFFKFYAFPY